MLKAVCHIQFGPERARLICLSSCFSGLHRARNLRLFERFCSHERAASASDRNIHPDRLEYLERTGELADADEAGRFLLRSVDQMVMQGERRRLMLANRAIDAYRHRNCGSPPEEQDMEKPTQQQLDELKRLSKEARTSDGSEVVQSKEVAETRIRDLKEKARRE